MERLLVVVPAYNEAASIGAVLREVREVLPDAGVLVVDDGSSDGTREAALAEGVKVLSLPFNLGVGGAMRAGFRYAVRHDYDAAVQVDADGQHDPSEVPTLVAGLDHADLVIGARFAGEGAYQVKGPRKWAMAVLRVVLSWVSGTKLTDTTSGFKASGRRILPLFAEYYPVEYLGDTIEALVIASRAGCKIAQVPAHMRERRAGNPSHSPLKAAVYLFRAGFALLLALIRKWNVSVRTSQPAALVEKDAVTWKA